MSEDSQEPILPIEFEAEWNDDKFYYMERAEVPQDRQAEDIIRKTEYVLDTVVGDVDMPEYAEVDVFSESVKGGAEVEIGIEITPGRPDGHEDLGLYMLCAELMAQLGLHSSEGFRAVVGTSAKISKNEELSDLAKIFDEMVMEQE